MIVQFYRLFFFRFFFLDSFKSKYSFISPSKAVSSQNNRGSMMDSLDHSSLKKIHVEMEIDILLF